ncbi:metal-dependent hydrolase [Niveibacterium terrae]|uniref:metal-dependent hydrolase n=1 Tax=Niveibacterium terrae TaxID=3373598 RepID=UPI003A8E079A
MPFTLFHLGPGIALKSLAGKRFSLAMFAGSQVAMDIEPGLAMLGGAATLHGYSHTLPGALAIALVCLPFKPLAERLFGVAIPLRAALAGTLVGVFSHLLLDALVHADIRPLWPFSDLDPLRGLMSWEAVELLCGALALAGLRWAPQGWCRLKAMRWF